MPISVLLIDGDTAHAHVVVRALTEDAHNWYVQLVPTLAQAQKILQDTTPDPAQRWDAILVSYPLADGCMLEMLDTMSDIPAIALFPLGCEALAAQALRRGFGDFLIHNTHPDQPQHSVEQLSQLAGVIEELLVRNASERARRQVEAELDRTSALLAEKTSVLEATLASISQGIIKVDAQGVVRLYNQRYLELLNLPQDLLQTQPTMQQVIQFQVHRGDFGPQLDRLEPVVQAHIASQCHAHPLVHGGVSGTQLQVYQWRTPSGRYLEARIHPVAGGGHVQTFTDVTDYMATQEALRQNEARWRSLTHLSSDWYWEQDAAFRFVRFDGSVEREFGIADQALYGKTRWEMAYGGVSAEQWDAHRAQLQAHQVFHDFEIQRTQSDGSAMWASISGEPIFDDQGRFKGYRGVGRNITERKRAEAEIQRLAFYDELTGLPNRRLLQDRLEHAAHLSARQGTHGALLFLDLDNFKTINDSLGHEWGDQLLERVALRLTSCVRSSDTVARLGGDEFVVILQNLHADAPRAAAMAEVVAHKILETLGQPYNLNGHNAHSTPSIGIALFLGLGGGASELLQRADMAMYQAKTRGRNTLCFFDEGMQAAATARSALEADMRVGLQHNEFFLHYQRVVDEHGIVLGAEALVRWQHPQHGMVSPAQFIPVAEQSGLILGLGRWVLHAACMQLSQWAHNEVSAHWTLSVNVSAQEFRHPDFVAQVLDILLHSKANPQQLKIELTESMLLHDIEDCIAKMQVLRGTGVRFSLDDFGTGYSSLSYLKRLPLDQLKIDQSFVRDILTDPNDAAIACTVIALGRSLGLEVVAEGVENHEQRKFLLRNGCHRFQGYLFGRPGLADMLHDAEQVALPQ